MKKNSDWQILSFKMEAEDVFFNTCDYELLPKKFDEESYVYIVKNIQQQYAAKIIKTNHIFDEQM